MVDSPRKEDSGPEVVIAIYRPFAEHEDELEELVRQHHAALREEQLVTDRAPIVMRSGDGSILEVFEWRSAQAASDAHSNPAISALWHRFGQVAEFGKLGTLPESDTIFPHFRPF